ncbi:outer membrane biosynthesis protein TonB [Sphingomonas jejuensis]|uniref:Outer membrane biosynthesis protein TonB n=1 Tax=Sphingomonas jejuensis TaxID=904715 RepID=A0ABX0XKV6_9SPHN|nr:hypothetical protein [Sphingomonas jejuensis]NJC33844.1 outer membrane biosynthesis protein TonB [Sphingomonas jejuensis]
MKRLPLIILLLLCGASACDNIADITPPTIPTPAPDPVPTPQPDLPAPEPQPEPPAPDPVPEPPAPDPEPTPEPPAPDPEPTPEPPAPDPAPEPPIPTEISPLDPATLLTEWQPRFEELGFRLEVGPGEPLPTIADPGQHRWPIALWQIQGEQLRAYYAVFAPAAGSEDAIADALSLIESYHRQAQQIAAGDLP